MTSEQDKIILNGVSGKEIYLPEEKMITTEKGIGEVILEEIVKHPNEIAQIDPATGKSETYESLLNRSIKVAQNLKLKGLKPGDVISMCTFNNLDYTPVILASFFIGTYTAPMDPTSPLCDYVHLLKIVTPKILFCDEDSEKIMEDAVRETGLNIDIVVFGNTKRNLNFTEFLIEQDQEKEFRAYHPENIYDTACIHFSSGTTGLPKAVCVTHYGVVYVCETLKKTEGKVNSKVIMAVTTPFWISNMNTLLLAMYAGDTRVLPKKFDERTCMKYCQDYKVQILFITPTNGNQILENPNYYAPYDLSTLKFIATGGSATPVKQFLEYNKILPGVLLIDGYGMTETSGILLKFVLKDIEVLKKTMKSCVGTPLPGFRYKLVNPETEELCGPNQPGELFVKCNLLFKTYFNDPKSYQESFDSEGFFKTGDVVYYDEDYKFYYVTRIKDIFKYKGLHISPVIIEQQLLKHPNIKETIVVGIPADTDGYYVTAAVVLRNKEIFDEEEVIQFANDNLPDKYHIRGGIYVIDSIPKTSTGKIKRRKVVEYILQKNN